MTTLDNFSNYDLIPTFILLLVSTLIIYYFRRSYRVHTILSVYIIYRLVLIDNSFYLCKYNNSNNNNNNNKYFTLPQSCIHSSLLNTTRESTHPNFCFTIPTKTSTTTTCNNNTICYKRRDKEGYNKQIPTFKTMCGDKLILDSNGNVYKLNNDDNNNNNNNNNSQYIITKPIIDNLDNDGYYVFLIIYIIFYKEFIYTDNNYNNQSTSFKKRLFSFILFSFIFLSTSIILIALKQKKDEITKLGTEGDQLFLEQFK